MTDTFVPVNSVSKVSMKGCMAVMDPIRDPSYPLAHAQQKATNTAKYKWMEVLLHLLIGDSWTAANSSAWIVRSTCQLLNRACQSLCQAGKTHVMNLLGFGTGGLVQGLANSLCDNGVMHVSRRGDAMVRLLNNLASLLGRHDEMVERAKISNCRLRFESGIDPRESSSTRRGSIRDGN